ncbi:MAG: twin-arginine translocase TatA/TatE family subunit [Magnetococcales bacterium]|nr:twin-arginine translocase TatA/TatE family subunit [Magnetococcales bacterium]
MFGMSWIEIFIILVVALLVIGPDKLPEVARGFARLIRQIQRIVHDVRESVNLEEFESRMRESSHYTPPDARKDPVAPRKDPVASGDGTRADPQSTAVAPILNPNDPNRS